MLQKIDTLSVGEAAKLLRVSVRTLQRWDHVGRLNSLRTNTNRRSYSREDLVKFVEQHDVRWRKDRTIYLVKGA